MYHTVVIGGGCLGAATAVSLQKKLNKLGKGEKVGLIEKGVDVTRERVGSLS